MNNTVIENTEPMIGDPVTALPAKVEQPAGVMHIINKLAENPTPQSVEVIERMMKIQREYESDAAKKAYHLALHKAMMEIPVIEKRGMIKFTGKTKDGQVYTQETAYLKYEDLDKVIRPILHSNDLVLTFKLVPAGVLTTVTGVMSHGQGHVEESSITLPLDTSGSKNNLQGGGSSISYAKRYIACAFLNIISHGEDDDGNGAPITDEQAAEIKQGLQETGLDTAKFLKTLKAESVEEIPSRSFARAMTAIDAQRYRKLKPEQK